MIQNLSSSLYIMVSYAFAGITLLVLGVSLYWKARCIERALNTPSRRQGAVKEPND